MTKPGLTQLDEALISRKVIDGCMNAFVERSISAALTSPLGTALLAIMQQPVTGWRVAASWFFMINLVEIFILAAAYRYRTAQRRGANTQYAASLIIFGTALAGLSWGISVWFFWIEGHFLHYLLNLTVLVGVLGISVVVMSPSRISMMLFAAGLLGPPLIQLTIVDTSVNGVVAAGLVIMFALVLQYCDVVHKQLSAGLWDAARNELLALELARRTSALEQARADLTRAQAVGNMGSWVYDISNDSMHGSDETCRIFGLPQGTTTTRAGYLARAFESDRNAADNAWRAALATGALDLEHRIEVGKTVRWVRQKAEIEFSDDGKPLRAFGTTQDITERKEADDEIRHLAFYDALTRLPNRRLLLDRLRDALDESARHHRYGALMLLDMDDFKMLNDTLGHDVGDRFLVEVAHRLQHCLQPGDTVARHGGDEFVIILENLKEDVDAALQAEAVANKILHAISQTYLLDLHILQDTHALHNTRSYHCTSSIGITLFCDNLLSVDELLKRADTAMYQAKAAGRNALRFFDPEMQAEVTARASLDNDLREAVNVKQFQLFYQPQVDFAGRISGVEALLRWQHPRRGIVHPDEFIAQAEVTGLILPIGYWVLESACVQLRNWSTQSDFSALSIAVNVSARQFREPEFVDQVLQLIERHGINPKRLKLELTESVLLDDVEEIIGKMVALKKEGIFFSLDDFGTGYSSLSYLKRLPLDQLKIDRSFVQNVLTSDNDASIARTIVALAQSMGLDVIAEGVETDAQREFLAASGCASYQGFLFGRPMPVSRFEDFSRRA